ncbi:MAG: DUF2085 domain-containing protein [Acidobacteriota bacterium]|nr:MAG: DUF2085 domain-containing protein [Acidobacteriota bacterium]
MGVVAWLTLVLAAPVARNAESGLAPFLYAPFASICHQIPARSISVLGHPMAVCARCFGLYLGFLLGLVVLPHWARMSGRLLMRPRLLVLFWIPLAIDLCLPNTALSRFVTGTVAAFPVALFVWIAIEDLRLSTARSYL